MREKSYVITVLIAFLCVVLGILVYMFWKGSFDAYTIQLFRKHSPCWGISNELRFWGIITISICAAVASSPRFLFDAKEIDKVFFLPPSFFALLSGALLGTSISFLTIMLPPIQPVKHAEIGALAMSVILSSSALLGYVSIALETMRDRVRGLEDEREHLRIRIESRRKSLRPSLFLAITFVILGFLEQYFALR